jgi:hypothetical protein
MNSGPDHPLMVARLMVVPAPLAKQPGNRASRLESSPTVRGGCLVLEEVVSEDRADVVTPACQASVARQASPCVRKPTMSPARERPSASRLHRCRGLTGCDGRKGL